MHCMMGIWQSHSTYINPVQTVDHIQCNHDPPGQRTDNEEKAKHSHRLSPLEEGTSPLSVSHINLLNRGVMCVLCVYCVCAVCVLCVYCVCTVCVLCVLCM